MSRLKSILGTARPDVDGGNLVDSALETVRRHLGMDTAYLSEVVGNRIIFRAVSNGERKVMIRQGDSRRFGEMFCHHILEGRLPRLIRDTRLEPLAMSMSITSEFPIGSHVSVPVMRDDGTVYGMFCCLSAAPNLSLNDRDLAVMELFADLSASQVNSALKARSKNEAIHFRIDAAIDGGFHIVFQPIRDLRTGATLGYEALSRFDSVPYRRPDQWFAEAQSVGRSTELEIHVLRAALRALPQVPAGRYLSINASPQAVASGELGPILSGLDRSRVMLEMTEHAPVEDYDRILAILAPLRKAGLKLAVDDAGAGYAGLQHILRLRPDAIKLDMSLTRDIDSDDARRSLASALITFAGRTNAHLIAEGIETEQEQQALLSIGVTRGQGYLLGRPVPQPKAFLDTDMAELHSA